MENTNLDQLSKEQLLEYIEELKANRTLKSKYADTVSQQLEHIDFSDPTSKLTLYEVKNAPYIVIGDAVFRQMKQRPDKRYHITRFDGTDGFLLLSDITREALKFNIRPLQLQVTPSSPQTPESNQPTGGSEFEL